MIGPLAYIGGKRRLARKLIALIPEHTTYVEPFAGGAQVFFAKDPSPVEVLNDRNDHVINFFRVVQLHEEELIRYLRDAIVSRSLYELYQRQDPSTLTDVQRAARFLYLQKNSFGGKVTGQNYHYCVSKPPNFNLDNLPELIRETRKRLARVQLESWPYERVIERFDRESTFFYLDPPYVGVTLYRYNLPDEAFAEMAERLSRIKGKFLLSINDHSVAREAFAKFAMREISLTYTATQSVPTVKELIFANYELPEIKDAGDVV